MVFSSNIFIYIFLPLCIISYYALKFLFKDKSFQIRNVALTIFSVLFYLFGSGRYTLILISVVCISYFSALLMNGNENSKRKIGIVAILLDLLILFFFKYFNFVYNSFSTLFNNRFHIKLIDLPQIFLPIGISFYIFQSLSYIADVMNGKVQIQKSFGKLLLYISFFPQLIAGPIVRYSDMENEINYRVESTNDFFEGLCRFIVGLAEKVLIADVLGESVDKIYSLGTDQLTQSLAISAAVMYSLEILFDFTGYSNMAIGIAEIFGFHFKENFDSPYTSKNMTEFWRRWHMSLSGWLRDYVYIPLGGNRKGKTRTYINLCIVFLICGIWHGANWTFLAWGIYHGFWLVVERVLKNKFDFALKSILGNAICFILVVFGWVLFRADSIGSSVEFIKTMIGITKPTGFIYHKYSYFVNVHVIITSVFALVVSFIPANMIKKVVQKSSVVNSVLMMILLVLCMIFMSGTSFNAFIYFKF